MLTIEVMEQKKAIELYSGPDKGLVFSSSLMNTVEDAPGCYSCFIYQMTDFHWKHAELYGKTDMVCFFPLSSDEGIAISGTREVGPEHIQQCQRISKALREVFTKEYEKFSDETKKTVDVLLKDYEENGFHYSPAFSTVYYDDGTTIKNSSPGNAHSFADDWKDEFAYLFKCKNPFDIKIPKNEGPDFNLNTIVVDDEGRRARVMGYEPETNQYLLMFCDAENIAADGWYSPDRLKPYEQSKVPEPVANDPEELVKQTMALKGMNHAEAVEDLKKWEEKIKEPFKEQLSKSSLDSIISRAQAISEQSKSLADDLIKHKTKLEL